MKKCAFSCQNKANLEINLFEDYKIVNEAEYFSDWCKLKMNLRCGDNK